MQFPLDLWAWICLKACTLSSRYASVHVILNEANDIYYDKYNGIIILRHGSDRSVDIRKPRCCMHASKPGSSGHARFHTRSAVQMSWSRKKKEVEEKSNEKKEKREKRKKNAESRKKHLSVCVSWEKLPYSETLTAFSVELSWETPSNQMCTYIYIYIAIQSPIDTFHWISHL